MNARKNALPADVAARVKAAQKAENAIVDAAIAANNAKVEAERKAALFAQFRAEAVKDAERDLLEYLERNAKQAERLAADLRRQIAQIAEEQVAPANGRPGKAERFGWAVNEVENFGRNVNAAQAVALAARYEVARMRAEADAAPAA